MLLSRQVTSASFATPWTVTCQAPLSMGCPSQEYWSGLLFPSPGDLPDPGSKPVSPALAGGFFTTEPRGRPCRRLCLNKRLAVPDSESNVGGKTVSVCVHTCTDRKRGTRMCEVRFCGLSCCLVVVERCHQSLFFNYYMSREFFFKYFAH